PLGMWMIPTRKGAAHKPVALPEASADDWTAPYFTNHRSERIHRRHRNGEVVDDAGNRRPQRQRRQPLRVDGHDDRVAGPDFISAGGEPTTARRHHLSVGPHDVDAPPVGLLRQPAAEIDVIVP